MMNLRDPSMGLERAFMLELSTAGGAKKTRQMQSPTRVVDRARQWCSRNGLVRYAQGVWSLTDAGRAAVGELTGAS